MEKEWDLRKYEFKKPQKTIITSISDEKYIVISENDQFYEVFDKNGRMFFVDENVQSVKIPINISKYDNNTLKNLFCLSLVKYIQ